MQLLESVESEKSIKSFSWRVMRRLRAAGDSGRTFAIEDIQQECRIAWFKASESYQAEMGVPFQAYLKNGMRLHINRLIEKNIDRRHDEVVSMSLDAELDQGSGNRASLAEIVADPSISGTTGYEEDQHFQYAIRKLKPRAKLFVTLLREQPKELLDEVIRMRKKSDYAREEMGIVSPTTNRLATWMIFDLMDASNVERTEIMKEVRALGERVCEAMSR